jgi:nucleoside-diphosphate-sugar epimerase
MKNLVTGATGFIGRHLVARLLERGEEVRILSLRRPAHDFPGVGALEWLVDDLSRPQALPAAVQGVERVYHLAGATVVLSPKTYEAVNAQGTRNLVDACARLATPPEVIFVSSLAAAGPTTAECPRVESQPAAPVSKYGRSKLAAEEHLRKRAECVPVTIVRPPGVIGPWDPHTIHLFRTVRRGWNIVPGRGRDRLSLIFVDDLVTGLLLAAERGRRLGVDGAGSPGDGIYFVAMDERPTLTEMAWAAAAVLNVPSVWTVRLPRFLCRLVAYASQAGAIARGKPALLTPDKMREATAGSWICSAEKARVDLGFTCTIGLAEGFRRTGEWYLRQGWL